MNKIVNIYNENNKNYINNGDMVLEPTSATLEMELNGLNIVTVEHPYDDLARYKSIKGDRVVKIDAPNNQTMLYKVNDTDRSLDDTIEFTARPLMQDLLTSALIDCRPTNTNGQQAIDKILEGTKFKGHSDISSTFTSHFIRKNRLEALVGDDENSFISKLGGELFTTGYDIWINSRLGSNKGVIFEYAKDIIDFNEHMNWDNVLTRVYPVGYDGITLDNNAYVDSSNINKYQEIKEGFIKFDHVKVKETPEDKEGFNTLAEAQAELIRLTKEAFENGLDVPTLEMNVEVEKLENTLEYKLFKNLLLVGLGDDVKVYIKHLDININIRVVGYTWDILNKKFINIKLGSLSNNFIQDQVDIGNILDNITNPDGSVNAHVVQGILNGINVQMKAMRDIAQNIPIRAMICEDLIKDSPTYGAMCWGTMGFMISDKRLPDDSDWDFRTFGTGKGFFADLIVAGTMLADRIKAGMLMSSNNKTWINMDNGTFNFGDKLIWNGLKMVMNGDFIQYANGGNKSVDIQNNTINFYDWERNGDYIGAIYSGTVPGNTWAHMVIKSDTGNPLNLGCGPSGGPRIILSDNKEYSSPIYIYGDTYCASNFMVYGSKNCIQKTESYGDRLFYSVEDGQSFLTETSESNFSVELNPKNGTFERCILINTIFKECVDLSGHYVIEINKVSYGDYKIKEQTPDGFILESDREDFVFNYCIKAKRKGYENVSLEEYINIEREDEVNG